MTTSPPSVLFVVRGDDTVPSCRFRAYQFRAPLERLGVKVTYLRIARGNDPRAHAKYHLRLIREARAHDAVVYQKVMHPARLRLLRALNENTFYDFDDALYVNEPERFARTIRATPKVIAGNDVLATAAARFNHRVHVVPTTVVLPAPAPPPDKRGPLRLSWIGTADNLRYLEPVFAALDAIRARSQREIVLEILTERPERVEARAGVTVERWSYERERAAFERCEVGLMPLVDDVWSRGKCACKALQYLSYGKPVLSSPVGMNRDLFADRKCGLLVERDSDWADAIRTFADRRETLDELGASGRRLVEARFDVERWAPRLRDVLFAPG